MSRYVFVKTCPNLDEPETWGIVLSTILLVIGLMAAQGILLNFDLDMENRHHLVNCMCIKFRVPGLNTWWVFSVILFFEIIKKVDVVQLYSFNFLMLATCEFIFYGAYFMAIGYSFCRTFDFLDRYIRKFKNDQRTANTLGL
mmetsp:Transcript_39603/g.60595  ORF Transcript_39603/g.60595 Transcript_39603/m.60595 type:complete len:142 (+) Transcript_39603:775-1200(+)